jgi:hypothetical protein
MNQHLVVLGVIVHPEECSGMILVKTDVVQDSHNRAEWCVSVRLLAKLIAFGASKVEFYHGWDVLLSKVTSPKDEVGLKCLGDSTRNSPNRKKSE